MHASTLRILETRFKPEDARVIAEAIEEEAGPSKFVTNDSLKLQLAELESRLGHKMSELEVRMSELEMRIANKLNALFNKLSALGIALAGLTVTVVLFMVLNLKK